MGDLRREWLRAAGAVLLFGAAVSGAVARFAALEFVDQRYQEVICRPPSAGGLLAAFAAAVPVLIWQYTLLCCGRRMGWRELCFADLPLLLWIPAWFFPLHYWMLPLYAAAGGLAAARFAACFEWESFFPWKRCFFLVGALALLWGVAGAWGQIWSFHKLAMQWFDWGHFYESLVNTLSGRFFYLDLAGGCYLGSRFCPSLLVLLPVAFFRSSELFLAVGALLIASGGVLTALAAKRLRLPPSAALLCGVTFLLLPGTINMMWATLDGFHEVFLLVPSVLGAWCCYRFGRRKSAAALWIFSLGVRESVGFMWAMWALVLMMRRRSRRDGAVLFLGSLSWSLLMILWIMPMISGHGGGYEHTVFFPHLGGSVAEILRSPFTRPEAFFGTLFSLHNLNWWLALFLPFLFCLVSVPEYLLALLPDLLMVSLDCRFDSQNLLRHYQMVPLLVLTVAMVEGIARLRNMEENRFTRALSAVAGKPLWSSAAAFAAGCAALLSCCFAQLPGCPAGDPRLPRWSCADEVMAEFFALIPPEVPVTAGPRLASLFAGRNELNVYRSDSDRAPFDRVIVESFTPMYGENALRLKLLKDPAWVLRHSAYLDERLIQYFERSSEGGGGMRRPARVVPMNEAQWAAWGAPVPCHLPEISLRGRMEQGHLLVGVRLEKPVGWDLGVRVTVVYPGREGEAEEEEIFFRSFGDGEYPACAAAPGEVWVMEMPLRGQPLRCRVDQLVLPVVPGDVYK